MTKMKCGKIIFFVQTRLLDNCHKRTIKRLDSGLCEFCINRIETFLRQKKEKEKKMSTKLTCSIFPSSILTPSTIQCTNFYSDAPKRTPFHRRQQSFSASSDMKRYLPKDHSMVKSATMPLTTTNGLKKPRLLNRYSQTFECLDDFLAENVRTCIYYKQTPF